MRDKQKEKETNTQLNKDNIEENYKKTRKQVVNTNESSTKDLKLQETRNKQITK